MILLLEREQERQDFLRTIEKLEKEKQQQTAQQIVNSFVWWITGIVCGTIIVLLFQLGGQG